MKATPVKRALIATHNLVGYAGSEVFTLELAVELRDMGWEVLVAALLVGEPIAPEFKRKGFQMVNLLVEPAAMVDKKFDLAWIHHAPVLYELLMVQKIEARTVVFCSLSHFEPLEAVPPYRGQIDLLLANSIENGNHIKEEFGLDESQIIIFPNAVPSNYWGSDRKVDPPEVRHVAIISNHPPPELLEAGTFLRRQGIRVTHIGASGTPVLVGPDLLLNYDVVITIGKSIPYCFSLRVPVYCYDHFGGPGWLNEANFDLARQNNFSGRGFFRKTSEAIANEIVKGYDESLGRLDTYRDLAAKSLNLRKNLTNLLAYPKLSYPEQLDPLGTRQVLTQHAQYIRLAKILSAQDTQLSALNKEILRVKSTVSWRITKPLRFVWNKFFRHAR